MTIESKTHLSAPTVVRGLLASPWLRVFLVVGSLMTGSVIVARADDAAAKTPEADGLYTPPGAREAAIIMAWVEKVSQTPSPDKSVAGLRAHFGKLEQAADALIARDIELDGLVAAIRLKVGANSILEQLGDTTAPERKQALIGKLKQDERAPVAMQGRVLEVEAAAAQLPPGNLAAAQKLLDQTVELLKVKPLSDSAVSVAYTVAEAIEGNADDTIATSAYRMFAKYLRGSDNPNHASVAAMFEGSARRLTLIGNSMDITGKTLDEQAFNLEAWKGKVVLVDFWATWCGPCVEELPNLKALYEKHHAAGFEIIGVNLDDNLGRVSAFVKTQGLAWPQLVSEQGQDNPLANYYGVYQLPTTFIIGRDGKVTAIDLFGDDLEAEVQKLLAVK